MSLDPISNWRLIPRDQVLKYFGLRKRQGWLIINKKQEVILAKEEPMYQMLSARASKIELIERFGHLNLKEIVHKEYPTIGSLERAHGKKSTSNAMAAIVSDLNNSFGKDLKTDDIMEIVTEVRVGLNRNITLEGLYLVCSQLKSSSIYGKLTVNKVLTAIKSHLNEQSNAHQSNNYNAHLAQKFSDPRDIDKGFEDEDYRKFKEDMNKNFTKDMKENG